jgi:hypothetical protein
MSLGAFELIPMGAILASGAQPVNKTKLCVKRWLMSPHVQEVEGD